MFRKRLGVSVVGAASLLLACLTGSASAEVQTRKVTEFESIKVGGSWTVEITVGKEASFTLEDDKALLQHIVTDVHDGTLTIEPDQAHPFQGWGHETAIARITLPRLEFYTLGGSGKSTITGLSGGATSLAPHGSGSLTATGRLDRLAVAINGSGSAELPDLTVADAGVTIHGSGDVVVKPQQSLAVTIDGSGKVAYVGAPTRVTSTGHGSGTVAQQ